MMNKKWIYASMLVVSSLTAFNACKKDSSYSSNGYAKMNMHLTDGPSTVYDHLYIDIKQVEVTMSGSSAVILAPIRAGVYDILQFRNGLDTLLMQANVPA